MPHLLIISFHQGLSVVRIVQCEERLQEVDSGRLYGIIDEETSLKVTKKPRVHEQMITTTQTDDTTTQTDYTTTQTRTEQTIAETYIYSTCTCTWLY